MTNNIVFIINSVGSGGAERALFQVIEAVPEHLDINIHLVLLDDEPRLKTLPKNAQVHQLNARRSLLRSLWQCYLLLKVLKPAVCVSFLVRANVLNSVMRLCRVLSASIVCERMHLSSHLRSQFSGVKRQLSKLLPFLLYRFNELVLGVSSGVSEDLVNHFGVSKSKIRTIYNPYDLDKIKKLSEQSIAVELNLPEQYIVSVGRLTKSKDQKTLIRGFAESSTSKHLVILGIGDLLPELQSLSTKLGVQERVHFLAYQSNPYPIIAKASYFVSTSLNEGFPNALLEAMVLGKAAIFTSCDSGPAEIFGEDYHLKVKSPMFAKYGVLIPEHSPLALTKAINKIESLDYITHYAQQGRLRAKDFSVENIANDYWQAIESFLEQKI